MPITQDRMLALITTARYYQRLYRDILKALQEASTMQPAEGMVHMHAAAGMLAESATAAELLSREAYHFKRFRSRNEKTADKMRRRRRAAGVQEVVVHHTSRQSPQPHKSIEEQLAAIAQADYGQKAEELELVEGGGGLDFVVEEPSLNPPRQSLREPQFEAAPKPQVQLDPNFKPNIAEQATMEKFILKVRAQPGIEHIAAGMWLLEQLGSGDHLPQVLAYLKTLGLYQDSQERWFAE